MFVVVGELRDFLGCDDFIVTSHKPSVVLLVILITGVLSELKMVTSFFVKILE